MTDDKNQNILDGKEEYRFIIYLSILALGFFVGGGICWILLGNFGNYIISYIMFDIGATSIVAIILYISVEKEHIKNAVSRLRRATLERALVVCIPSPARDYLKKILFAKQFIRTNYTNTFTLHKKSKKATYGILSSKKVFEVYNPYGRPVYYPYALWSYTTKPSKKEEMGMMNKVEDKIEGENTDSDWRERPHFGRGKRDFGFWDNKFHGLETHHRIKIDKHRTIRISTERMLGKYRLSADLYSLISEDMIKGPIQIELKFEGFGNKLPKGYIQAFNQDGLERKKRLFSQKDRAYLRHSILPSGGFVLWWE